MNPEKHEGPFPGPVLSLELRLRAGDVGFLRYAHGGVAYRPQAIRSPLAALRGLQFGVALQIAERPPVVSEVLCWAGSAFCRGIEQAVAAAKRRPISRAEILGELEERTGLRVWSLPWGPIVGGSGDPDRMSCSYLEDPAGLLGLHPVGREEVIFHRVVYTFDQIREVLATDDARKLRKVRG